MSEAAPAETIACDESGSEGENLRGTAHRVFAHGSVWLGRSESEALVDEIKRRAPSQAPEYKSEQLLRANAAGALAWLLRADELQGRARIHLIDKEYFVVGKVIDLLVEELAHASDVDLYADGEARRLARVLYSQGPRALGEGWDPLLDSFNSLMRARQRKGTKATVNDFYAEVGKARFRSHRRAVSEILDLVYAARRHAERFQSELDGSVSTPPALDPLFAAIPQAARSWHGQLRRPLRIVHDTQASLTSARVASMLRVLRRPPPEFARFAPRIQIVELEQVDSRIDARVQLADLMAGVGRVVAENLLAGHDEVRAELIGPFVDEYSLWSDPRSWQILTGRELRL